MGCRIVQLQWIDPSVPPEAVADALRASGLQAVSSQDLYPQVQENPDYYLKLNKACGCGDLCVSRIPAQYRSEQGLAQFASQLRSLHDVLRDQGMTLSFHPCRPEYDVVEGAMLVERLLALLSEDVTLCLDLYHAEHAGLSLPGVIERFAGRVSMVHFKDYTLAPDGTERLAPAGQGRIDWSGVMNACKRAGVHYAFVEQETWEGDPFERLHEAFDWLDRACAR